MMNLLKDKAAEFLAFFNDDLSAAQEYLLNYARGRQKSQRFADSSIETIISLKNVSKHYKLKKQTIQALNDTSLTIGRGEFIAITGASGSGKSTLLQLIGCLDKPSSGEISIENRSVSQLNDDDLSELRQRTIGFVFQSFYLQPFLRLHDNIAVPAMFTDKKSTLIDENVNRLLQTVGLENFSHRFPKQLSGGQIQRAAIARALVNNPSILLADEPTGNLDIDNRQSIIDLFLDVRKTLNTTVIVVTHDPYVVRHADRVIMLTNGEIK